MGKQARTREELRAAREAAQARSEAKFEELVDDYPIGHRAGRDRFVRLESEKMVKEIEDRQMQVIPEADKADLRRGRR